MFGNFMTGTQIGKMFIGRLSYIGSRGIMGCVPFSMITKSGSRELRHSGKVLVYDGKGTICWRTKRDIGEKVKPGKDVKMLEAANRKALAEVTKLRAELKEMKAKGGDSPSVKMKKQIEAKSKKLVDKEKSLGSLQREVASKGGVVDVEVESSGNRITTARQPRTDNGGTALATSQVRRDVRRLASAQGSSDSGVRDNNSSSNKLISVNTTFKEFVRFIPAKLYPVSYHKSAILDIAGGLYTHVRKCWNEEVLYKLVDIVVANNLTSTSQWRRTIGQDRQFFTFSCFLIQYFSFIAYSLCVLVKIKARLSVRRKHTERDNTQYGVAAYYRRLFIGVEPKRIEQRVEQLERQLASSFLPSGLVSLLCELSVPFFDTDHDRVLQSGILYEINPVFATVRVKTRGRSFELVDGDVSHVKLSGIADHADILKKGLDPGDNLLNTVDMLIRDFKNANITWLEEGLGKINVPKLDISLLENIDGYPNTRPSSRRHLLKNCSNLIDAFNINNIASVDPRVDIQICNGLVWHDKRDTTYLEDGGLKVSPVIRGLSCHKINRVAISQCTNSYQPGFVRTIIPEHDVDFSIHKREDLNYEVGTPLVRLLGKQRSIPHVTMDYMAEWVSKKGCALDGNAPGCDETTSTVHEKFYEDHIASFVKELWDWECLKG